MPFELAFTPQGSIVVDLPESGDQQAAEADHWRDIAHTFAECQAEGLLLLAAEKREAPATPTFAFWRDFASRYLTALSHQPSEATSLAPIEPPCIDELTAIIDAAPPMKGAEYLNEDRLRNLWQQLDQWTRQEVASDEGGLAGFLQRRAPLWRQVGRVCFHLAENKRDPRRPFAFLATYAQKLSAAGKVQHLPLQKALQQYAGAKNRNALLKLLSPVHEAAKRCDLVKEMVDSGDIYQPLAWQPPQAHRFLKAIEDIEDSGVVVRMPDWWKKRPRPVVSVTVGDKRKNYLGMNEMLDFRVAIALGGEPLSPQEVDDLLGGEQGLVMLRGQWVEVDREKLTQALEHWKQVEEQASDGISFIEGMRLLAGAPKDLDEESPAADPEWSFVDTGKWLGKTLKEIREPENIAAAKPGKELHATLRPYQETGVAWLSFMSRLGLGACLADDMGLGKTIQVLAMLAALKEQDANKPDPGPSLLVLPASLLANWKTEIERFTPSLKSRTIHPSQMKKTELDEIARAPDEALRNIDLAITTYSMLARQTWLRDVQWSLVILDEAQAIKNPAARQTKTVKQLQAGARIAMTGTPVENRLADLWSLFDFLCPGLLGSQKKFKDFVKLLNARETNKYAPLRKLVQPYILRRLKTDKRIIADLPEKTEVQAYCGLSKKQAALYGAMVKEMSDAIEKLDGIQRRGLVLSFLQRFKQCCNHPSQLLGDGEYALADSGKFFRLVEICDEIASRQEKVLVFTQFREMTAPLQTLLSGIFGREGLTLHGSTPVKSRKQLVERFQRDDGPPFFVLSLKAGGVGLNLTAASHVIHFDRWWNPAVENQATDRAFRIGQKRNVLVHKFVCEGTIEERIDEMIREKSQIASEIMEGGAERMLTEMSDAELIDFVSLDVQRAKI